MMAMNFVLLRYLNHHNFDSNMKFYDLIQLQDKYQMHLILILITETA